MSKKAVKTKPLAITGKPYTPTFKIDKDVKLSKSQQSELEILRKKLSEADDSKRNIQARIAKLSSVFLKNRHKDLLDNYVGKYYRLSYGLEDKTIILFYSSIADTEKMEMNYTMYERDYRYDDEGTIKVNNGVCCIYSFVSYSPYSISKKEAEKIITNGFSVLKNIFFKPIT